MAERIVSNKHFGRVSDVSSGSIVNLGQIAISNEVGQEGIFILNNRGEVIRVGFPDVTRISGDTIQVLMTYLSENYYTKDHVDLTYFTSAETENTFAERQEVYVKDDADEFFYPRESADTMFYTSAATEDRLSTVKEETITEVTHQIVSGAPETLDTLQEIAEWIEENPGGSAALTSAVTILQEFMLVAENQIQEISARTPTLVTTDHVVLTSEQYQRLIKNGSIVLSGETIMYSDDVFYCIYEDEEPIEDETKAEIDETTGVMTLTGVVELSEDGETLIITGAQYDESTGILTFEDGGDVPPGPEPVEPSIDDRTGEGVFPSLTTDEEIEETGVFTLGLGAVDGDTLIIG